MKRRILVVPLAALAAMAAAPAVLADPPTMEDLPPAQDFVDTFCGFPILLDFEDAEPASVTSFFDENGRLVRQIGTFPGLRVTITNLETGESIEHSLSGSGVKEFLPDGSTTLTATGPSGIWNRIDGVRGRFVTIGRVVEARDANGALVSRTLDGGRLIDVCAELAP